MFAVFAEGIGVLFKKQIAEAFVGGNEIVRLHAEDCGTKFVNHLIRLFRSNAGIEFQQCLFQPDIHHDGIHRTRHLIGRNILPTVLLRLLDQHFLNIGFIEHCWFLLVIHDRLVQRRVSLFWKTQGLLLYYKLDGFFL